MVDSLHIPALAILCVQKRGSTWLVSGLYVWTIICVENIDTPTVVEIVCQKWPDKWPVNT